jgi:hypothetical protein
MTRRAKHRPDTPKLAAARALGTARTKAKADLYASKIAPVIRELQREGASLRAISKALKERGIPCPRGGQWQATSVKNVLARSKEDI